MDSKTTMKTNVFGSEPANTAASKLETHRADNKTVKQTHFYRNYQQDNAPKGTYNFKSNTAMASRHPICSLLFLSVHAIPEKLAQRLLVSGLSVSQSPFSLLLFLRHWVSLSPFSRLIHDECNKSLRYLLHLFRQDALGGVETATN